MENQIKITATTSEQFSKIEELLKTLPDVILESIESARFGAVGCECIFKNNFKEEFTCYLPNNTRQINDFGDYIGIYCDDFFFKIPKEISKKASLKYIFIDVKK